MLTFNNNSPMFVSWKTKIGHQLRGCIGTTNPINLIDGLRDYSLKSALQDNRFSPIKASELESLVCTVSLLTDYEECVSFDDWNIGIHGISFEFQDIDCKYRALFLPEVMIEHGNVVVVVVYYFIIEFYYYFINKGFNHEEAIKNLLRKSGYRKTITNDLLQKLKFIRFKSEKESFGVESYLQIRKKRMNQPKKMKHLF